MDVSAETHAALQQLLQEQSAFFLGIISSYVVRMDLARGDTVQSVALVVWQATVIEALAHPERFARASQPRFVTMVQFASQGTPSGEVRQCALKHLCDGLVPLRPFSRGAVGKLRLVHTMTIERS